jgi:hypothetical protein
MLPALLEKQIPHDCACDDGLRKIWTRHSKRRNAGAANCGSGIPLIRIMRTTEQERK